ncbi:MAG TPA: NblA/ycf18 family protein [Leptolyngbyaceae cyanobacterium M65_K2018_010]|nr:NblA/ycf18 family protein [Leptolyngbyaceae cyanobacterium M65_K2018_010]
MESREQLSLEQQFELRLFEDQVRNLSLEEAQELLIRLRETMAIQANTFRDILKEAWGIGQDYSRTAEY